MIVLHRDLWLVLVIVVAGAGASAAQLTAQQAKRIEAAIPSKARFAPKRPRRVLIWNTPFMEQSPHKGYSIPQAEYAMRLLGERTGAFEPIVSDDVAMYLPGNIRYNLVIVAVKLSVNKNITERIAAFTPE